MWHHVQHRHCGPKGWFPVPHCFIKDWCVKGEGELVAWDGHCRQNAGDVQPNHIVCT